MKRDKAGFPRPLQSEFLVNRFFDNFQFEFSPRDRVNAVENKPMNTGQFDRSLLSPKQPKFQQFACTAGGVTRVLSCRLLSGGSNAGKTFYSVIEFLCIMEIKRVVLHQRKYIYE
jgi:hypothetical protein